MPFRTAGLSSHTAAWRSTTYLLPKLSNPQQIRLCSRKSEFDASPRQTQPSELNNTPRRVRARISKQAAMRTIDRLTANDTVELTPSHRTKVEVQKRIEGRQQETPTETIEPPKRIRARILNKAVMRAINGTPGEVELTPAQRREIEIQKRIVRRQKQRLEKHEMNLLRLMRGKWKRNTSIHARIRGSWSGDSFMDSASTSMRGQGRESRMEDAWSGDSFMDEVWSGAQSSDSTSRGGAGSAGRSFGNVQKIALERALGGTAAVLSSRARRKRYAEEVIKPAQELSVSKPGKSAAELAISKHAFARARILRARNSKVRYVGLTSDASSRRSYHVEARSVRRGEGLAPHDAVDWEQAQSEWRPEEEATDDTSSMQSESPQKPISIAQRPATIDSDVLYQAFTHFFEVKYPSDDWLLRARRLGILTPREVRMTQLRLLEERFVPALDVWKSLVIRWRQQAWHAVVGLREDEIEDVGQLTIRRETLAKVVADMNKRRKEGRPRLRDDPLWEQIIHGRSFTMKEQLDILGLNDEEIFVWWHVRKKFRAHTGGGTPLGDTRHQVRKFAAVAKHDDVMRAEREEAVLSWGERRLREWEVTAKEIEREIWLFTIGVDSRNTELRIIAYKDIPISIKDVRTGMAYWSTARDHGLPRPHAANRSWLLRMKEKLNDDDDDQARAHLLAKRRQALRRADMRLLGKDTDLNALPQPSDEELLGVQSKELTRSKERYLPYQEYRTAQRLIAVERAIDKIKHQLDAYRLELYSVITGMSFDDPKTHQYISLALLDVAVKSYTRGYDTTTTTEIHRKYTKLRVNRFRDEVRARAEMMTSMTPGTQSLASDQVLGSDERASEETTSSRARHVELLLSSKEQKMSRRRRRDFRDELAKRARKPESKLRAKSNAKSNANPQEDTQSQGNAGNEEEHTSLSMPQLRRLNKAKRRYTKLLQTARPNTDLLEDHFELPHEIHMRSPGAPPPIVPTSRLLAPLRRMPNLDELPPPKDKGSASVRELTHLSASGEAHMVSVAAKPYTKRSAIAVGKVRFSNNETYNLVTTAALKKGDVLAISRIAGIQAAKMCPTIIPLCHPIMISNVKVDVLPFSKVDECGVDIESKVECTGPTGVEMEALTAVMGAALTVIDMVKAVDKAASIEGVKVVYKSGGKNRTWIDEEWDAGRQES